MCDFSLDTEVNPGAIIMFSSPAEIHLVLGQLPAVLVIPPEINPPPAVPPTAG